MFVVCICFSVVPQFQTNMFGVDRGRRGANANQMPGQLPRSSWESGICPSHLRNSRKVVEGKGGCGEKITLRLIWSVYILQDKDPIFLQSCMVLQCKLSAHHGFFLTRCLLHRCSAATRLGFSILWTRSCGLGFTTVPSLVLSLQTFGSCSSFLAITFHLLLPHNGVFKGTINLRIGQRKLKKSSKRPKSKQFCAQKAQNERTSQSKKNRKVNIQQMKAQRQKFINKSVITGLDFGHVTNM